MLKRIPVYRPQLVLLPCPAGDLSPRIAQAQMMYYEGGELPPHHLYVKYDEYLTLLAKFEKFREGILNFVEEGGLG